MTFKKKKKGDPYVVTWDSDASSSDDNDDSDDNKITKKKVLASIAINEKPSLFNTPSTCFMAKALRYNVMMMDMKVIVKVIMMMNQLKMN